MITKKLYTLVFVFLEDKVLLGYKKRGFGIHKWNGFGGKVEPNENILDAAVRELNEECSLTVNKANLNNIGSLEFTFEGEPLIMDVRVFTTNIFEGTPMESEEMRAKWFHRDKLPYENMWLDDKYWFPFVLKSTRFHGKFHYEGYDKILSWNITELPATEPKVK